MQNTPNIAESYACNLKMVVLLYLSKNIDGSPESGYCKPLAGNLSYLPKWAISSTKSSKFQTKFKIEVSFWKDVQWSSY